MQADVLAVEQGGRSKATLSTSAGPAQDERAWGGPAEQGSARRRRRGWRRCGCRAFPLGSRVNFDSGAARGGRRTFAEIVDAEAELDRPGATCPARGRVERENSVAGRELAPERRLEFQLQAELVAVEGDRPVHVRHIFDCVGEAHVLLLSWQQRVRAPEARVSAAVNAVPGPSAASPERRSRNRRFRGRAHGRSIGRS